MNIKSIKTQLSLFLGLFALYLSFVEKNPRFLVAVSAAILSSIVMESLINYIKNKRFSITESSVVTGLIIGYVISSYQPLWVICLASTLAIISKHIVRFRKSHIFNPAGFGIFLVVVVLGAYTQWKAAYAWHIIIPLGIYFASRIKRLDLVASYFIASIFLYAPQAFLNNASLLDTFSYFNYFFIFVMMVEPRTTPKTRLGRIMFGLGAAVFIFGFYESGVLLEVELFSLLILNFLGVFLERRKA
ncbi:MAG: RnfABCDGE type electron transport complex subunit D [Candidatus Omnitrophica bacterium]|nr:RnfABCDGE type electron transport complex subunit D [Candidatus Omnitrophota bacterium]MBU4589426.1 RnfABCDGE type electron transport complex subunit D [Candidatus Omnitrophota bacterium]